MYTCVYSRWAPSSWIASKNACIWDNLMFATNLPVLYFLYRYIAIQLPESFRDLLVTKWPNFRCCFRKRKKCKQKKRKDKSFQQISCFFYFSWRYVWVTWPQRPRDEVMSGPRLLYSILNFPAFSICTHIWHCCRWRLIVWGQSIA